MSNILFVTWDGGGNVPPALAIAGELRTRGESVRFLGHARQREAIEAAGFRFEQYRAPGSWIASADHNGGEETAGFLQVLTGRSLGQDVLGSVSASPTDLVVVDCLLFGVLDVLDQTTVKRAILVHSLFTAVEQTMFDGPPGGYARSQGLEPRTLFSNVDAVIVASLEELDRPSIDDSIVLEHTGPTVPEGVSPAHAHVPPRVLVSLSTTFIPGQQDALQRILNSLAPLPIEVVVTTGPAIDPAHLEAPANAIVHSFVPHAEIMPNASLVLHHGGHATTMVALAHDLPMVIMPMQPAFDQPIMARTLTEAGVAAALTSTSSEGEIRAAVESMLVDGPHRAAAARLGAEVRAAHGAANAAARLVELVDEGGVTRSLPMAG